MVREGRLLGDEEAEGEVQREEGVDGARSTGGGV